MKKSFITLFCMVSLLSSCSFNDVKDSIFGNFNAKEQANNQETYHTVTFDTGGGTTIEAQQILHGEKANKPDDPTRNGYTFDGWYYQNEPWVFQGYVVTDDMTITAKWNIIIYSISYDLNGGFINETNPTSYTVEDEINLSSPYKTGYTFLGWYDQNDNKIEIISKESTGDLSLQARWSVNLYSLVVTSNDPTKGTIEILSGSGYCDEQIIVVATPIGDCAFDGWYHNDTMVSDKTRYSFIMPAYDYSLEAHFIVREEWNINHGVIPRLSDDGKTLTYGLYPQSNVDDEFLISELNKLANPELNDWYLYENEYYAKTTATIFNPEFNTYIFENGTPVVEGVEYWFKCEPIEWNILSDDAENYFILSSILLDTHRYNEQYQDMQDGHYDNNYEYSEIRSWLNNDFYNSAFALKDSFIQLTNVDNSDATTNYSGNPYSCDNTQDKIFLLSYQDYLNNNYGFDSISDTSETRQCKVTDWAIANGAECNLEDQYFKNGFYWTRSPAVSGVFNFMWPGGAYYITSYGSLYAYADCVASTFCVRPALNITLR